MGFFSELLSGIGEVMVESLKPEVSNSETMQDFTSQATGDLTSDDQYIEIFSDALRELARNRSSDTYIQRLWRRSYGRCREAVEDGYYGNTYEGNFVVWRVFYGEDDNCSIKLRLKTPNALQKDRDGDLILSGCGYRVSANYDAEKAADELENKRRRSRKLVTSFLGVKFGSNACSCEKIGCGAIPFGDGLVSVQATMNQLLSFDTYMILKAEDNNEIVGVICKCATVGREDVDSFVKQLCSILSEKYQRDCDYNSKGKMCMIFYEDEVSQKDIYLTMTVVKDKEGNVTLIVCNEKLAAQAYQRHKIAEEQRITTARADSLEAL